MFTYRAATVDDIPFLAAIRLEVTEHSLTDPTRLSRAKYHDYLTTDGRGWVCEEEGVVVGFVIAATAERLVWALFVHPEYEGYGIGSKLLERAVSWLFDSGADGVSLLTHPDTRMASMCKAKGWQDMGLMPDNHVHFRLPRNT